MKYDQTTNSYYLTYKCMIQYLKEGWEKVLFNLGVKGLNVAGELSPALRCEWKNDRSLVDRMRANKDLRKGST